jgi:hypothetical protein
VRLKIACWTLAILTGILLLGWPAFVGVPPKGAPKPIVKQYLVRSEIYFAALLASFLGATVFAALVVRQTRNEYMEASAENLRALIEGTLEDHKKKTE